ncbi:MAG: hypothetical protein N2037_14940, partial [Acidimicrobiales bacterium]|nr:hypothetical protein [Acidimicrobiales bacterium]
SWGLVVVVWWRGGWRENGVCVQVGWGPGFSCAGVSGVGVAADVAAGEGYGVAPVFGGVFCV